MAFWQWSKIAANNNTSDLTCPFPEGMSPSAVNDGVRAAMARLAEYRDDISGALVTAGTSSFYTLTTNQGLAATPNDGQLIAFTPHVTNGALGSQLAVDGGNSYIMFTATGASVLVGTLIQGTPYVAKFSAANSGWMLHGFYGNPYNIPLLGGMDYWGTTAPNSSFVFPVGQAISRTTYATAFAIMGTTFGVGDGSTTFNLPDKRGRVAAAADNMGGAGAGRISLGFSATGGEQAHTLTAAELAPHSHGFSGTTGGDSPDHTHATNITDIGAATSGTAVPGGAIGIQNRNAVSGGASARHAHPFSGATDTGSGVAGAAHNNMQPTIACNYIIRII
jgi:microcystin-dependent protein